jgi:hypothetical protein
MHHDVPSLERDLQTLKQIRDPDAFPGSAKFAPSGDAVDVADLLGGRKAGEVVPVEHGLRLHEPGESKEPGVLVDVHDRTGLKHGEVFDEPLARRDTCSVLCGH